MSNLELSKSSFFRNPTSNLWTGRVSQQKEYWHEHVEIVENLAFNQESSDHKVAILGYAVDEGITRNQGRIGASNGPLEIRKVMGTLAYHLNPKTKVYDYGDIICDGDQLEKTHSITQHIVSELLKQRHFPILLGGGHDLAYAHLRGIDQYLSQIHKKYTLGIINLDAHFDLRPLVNGQAHSGSPFHQWAKFCKSNEQKFHYLCLGIQKAANPHSLFETANKFEAQWIEIEDFQMKKLTQILDLLQKFLDKVDYIYLSIDIDGFSSAFAPGVSAPSPMGFYPEVALEVILHIISSKKLISTDIVEYNPTYDQDNVTAKLAARLVEYILRNKC
jgi:formiminoglutamase